MRQRTKEDRRFAHIFGGAKDDSDLSTVQPIDTSRKLPTRPGFSTQGQRLVDMNTPPDNAALEAAQKAAWTQPVVPPQQPKGFSEGQPWGTTPGAPTDPEGLVSMDSFAASMALPATGTQATGGTAGGTAPAATVYEKKASWSGGGNWQYDELTGPGGTEYHARSPKSGKVFVIKPGTKNPATGEDMFEAIRKEREQSMAAQAEVASVIPSKGEFERARNPGSATPSGSDYQFDASKAPPVGPIEGMPNLNQAAVNIEQIQATARDRARKGSTATAVPTKASGGPQGYTQVEGMPNLNQAAVNIEQIQATARDKAAKGTPKPRYVSDMGSPAESDLGFSDVGESDQEPYDPTADTSEQEQRSFEEMVYSHEQAYVERPAGEKMPAKAKTDLRMSASDPDSAIGGYIVTGAAGGNIAVTTTFGRPIPPSSPNYIRAITLAVRQDLVQKKLAEMGPGIPNTAPGKSADISTAMAANMPKS